MRQVRSATRVRQRGLVLLLIVLSLLAIGGAVLLTGLVGGKTGERRLAEGASADQRLLIARDSLLGYAVGNIADAGRPGQLPAPDNLQDGNYDGTANNGSCLDGTAVNGLPALTVAGSANFRCVGKLPWKTLGISSEGVDEFDSTGIVPWYAVSANLSANNICLSSLNPATVFATPVSYVCGVNAPPFPWLKVCDQTGKLLSDRVAFVVIVPGAPIATVGRTQSRAGLPRPQPVDYLDAIPVPAGWGALAAAQRCTAYDNAALNNEFVTADTTDGFNDRLLYVTIDELMARVESRVAQQVREALVKYESTYTRYPWLVPIGDPTSITNAFVSTQPTTSGLVPFHTPTPGEQFKSELAWSIGNSAASDTVVPATTSSPAFLCFGGAYQCRIRTTGTTAAIPRTVTAAIFLALKSSSVATPSLLCSYTTLSAVNCDIYTYTQTQSVSYNVQRRTCCGAGTYVLYGSNYLGTQTRTITVQFTGITASGSPTYTTDASNFVRRSITTASVSSFGMLSAVDRWVPNGPIGVPFDIPTTLQTGSASTNGSGVVTLSNIRVLPELPTWYAAHKWHEFMFAAISSDASPTVGGNACSANCFSAGARNGLHAVVISAGKMIAAQNRYSGTPTVNDFLEAPNNTGSTTRIFAEPNAKHTSTYADTIAPIPR